MADLPEALVELMKISITDGVTRDVDHSWQAASG
jgi:hypothetical protein